MAEIQAQAIIAALRQLADALEGTELRPAAQVGAWPRFTESAAVAVARVYRAALESGHPPTQAVRDAFQLTDAQAGKWVSKTRRMGYLPPTTSGRASA